MYVDVIFENLSISLVFELHTFFLLHSPQLNWRRFFLVRPSSAMALELAAGAGARAGAGASKLPLPLSDPLSAIVGAGYTISGSSVIVDGS